jgi:hypothetical protein
MVFDGEIPEVIDHSGLTARNQAAQGIHPHRLRVAIEEQKRFLSQIIFIHGRKI